MLFTIDKITHLNFNELFKQISVILLTTIAMALLVFLIQKGIYQLTDKKDRIGSLINVSISVTIGGIFNLYVTLKIRLANRLLGSKVAGIRRKLRIK